MENDQNPPQPPELPSAPSPAPAGPTSPDERRWLVILHLSALAGLVVPTLGHILGPLVVWLLKKNDFPAMEEAGKEVLNFQISWTILGILSAVAAVAGSCLVFPMALPIALFVLWLYLVFKGAIRASNGEPTAFPLTIRFLS
jgi:hypothetical protein